MKYMKLPTYLTTVTPLSKAVALSLFIFFPIVAFILGLNFGYYGKQLEDTSNETGTVKLLKGQLLQQDQEMDDIINDRGTYIREYDTPYQDEEFGLYSPLFENKQNHVTVYKYKRTLITRREVQVDPKTYAVTWTYELIPPNNTPGIVIFDAYENHGMYGIPIEGFKEQWDKEKSYISNNRTFYWNYGYAPKALTQVFLEGVLPNATNNKSVFFRLSRGVDYSEEDALKKQSNIDEAKTELQKIADQIPYRKTN